MNLPNKLTIFRIILIPFYVLFLLLPISDYHYLIATLIFIIASLTDLFDGKIARKYNLVTNFGKFADPLADKLLVSAGLICFVELGFMPSWVCIIIISREFAVSGFRLVCAEKGAVIAASMWGKVKTTFQMIFIIMTSLNIPAFFGKCTFITIWEIVRNVIMYAALALTIISMIDYFYKNRNSFSTNDRD